uniref:ABC-type glutathione-S-conjugate transporter n=1 Tax=Electrophorus electricus TaxID=8005 RepID=A0A4W4G3P4_ELEEL
MNAQLAPRRLCGMLSKNTPWDWNLTWYTPHPDLTQCFQHTVLVWLPCLYLWLGAPFYLVYRRFRDHGRISVSALCGAKTVKILLQITVFIFLMNSPKVMFYTPLYSVGYDPLLCPQVLAVCIVHVERMKGCRSSAFLFLFWALAFVCSLVPLRGHVQGFSGDAPRFLAFFTCFSLQLAQLVLSCFADQRPATLRPNPCPVEDASFLSKILFWWFSGLVTQGFRSPLKAEDLWSLREEDTSEKIIRDLVREWTTRKLFRMLPVKHLARCVPRQDKCESPPRALSYRITEQTQLLLKLRQEQGSGLLLLRTLAKTFGPCFLTGTLCLIVQDAFMFSIPQVLSLLLGFVRDEDAPLWKGHLFAVTLFLLSCLQSLFNHQYMYTCFTVGMRVKTAIMGLIYRKTLIINSAARRACTVGEIVNLVSADTQKLMDFVVYFNAVWLAPIEIGLCLFFLWQRLGPSALAGIATVILIFPLNGLIAKMRSKLQVQMKYMDGRIKLMNEILNGIKILKFYAWEKAFQEKVLAYREEELKALKKSQILYSISIASFNSSTFLIAFAMFGVYVLTDEKNVLDAQKVFVSMALINILKTPLSQLPFAMSSTMQAIVSLRRLGKFLQQDELRPDCVVREPYSPGECAVTIVNVEVPHGSVVAVVGHVGSGKSSLLSAMLGETEKRSGHVTVKGSVAYVPQQAWIQNTTLRENIVFGQERRESWYHRVLEACALLPDLDVLPGGDATEIGEKGLNLSGGQKQRVSLARAVYRTADVYLLDDPLSAVDPHVGQHIFHKVIGPKGILRDKTRVLVTHALSFLPQVDLILVMVDGEITETGSYAELLGRQGAFADFTLADSEQNQDPEELGKLTEADEARTGRVRVTAVTTAQTNLDVPLHTLSTGREQSTKTKVSEHKLLFPYFTQRPPQVKLDMYVEYFRTIGPALIVPIIFLYAFQQAASLGYNYWLRLWADDPVVNGTQTDADAKLAVFCALGFAQGRAIFGTTVAISLGGIMASRHLHLDLLNNVLRSPMQFFERTPSGNLLNCFSKEVDAIDCMIPEGFKMMLGYVFKMLEVATIVLMASPLAGFVILPLTLFYTFIQSFYVATSCQLRRLESVSRSPIYTHFNETVQGASVIRAFRVQPRFILQANSRVDHNQTAYFPRFVATRWLAVNLEFLGNVLVLAAAIFSVTGRATLSPGIVGLAVSHSLQVTGILSWIVRAWTDVENNIVSVERVKEYSETPKEAAWTTENRPLPSAWPQTGTIEFQEYGLQYRKGLDWALKEITLSVQEREKVGIVGRTGAGKSSLALGIFRILEAAKGKISIDGIDIAEVGLQDLRSRVTIIPQDPVLFSGSLRMSLDPFDSYSDEEVWRALELAHLKSFVSGLPDKLQHECSEGGENLSLGQRQLVCLARALLRKTKVLVLDEATAAVDLETDNLIQSTIRTQFEECTVLTIAHRLNTIMDYTRVIVMDRGYITEMDSPGNLITKRGHFYRMCVEAGLV